jgi:zinc/manganese transport system substrate-binding protein
MTSISNPTMVSMARGPFARHASRRLVDRERQTRVQFMKPVLWIAMVATMLTVLSGVAEAKTKIVVTYPYIASLVQQIAKERVDVTVLAKGSEDPHFVVPRPSFIGKLRQADLLIINGASLEIGFVPPLIRQANNPKIVPGAAGFIDLSRYVELIDKPANVSRAEGDVHPEGNPHFILDWHNVPAVARAIADALRHTDREGSEEYQKSLDAFLTRWKGLSAQWDVKAQGLQGKKVIQYHRLFNYFTRRTGMTIVGELEPKPGIVPTSRHLEDLLSSNERGTIYRVFADSYHERKSVEGLAGKLAARWVVLPQDVDAVAEAKDIVSLYDALLARVVP